MSGFLCRPKSKMQKKVSPKMNPPFLGIMAMWVWLLCPPLPPYSEPGKIQSSGVLCPLWTLWLIIHHHHHTSWYVSFLKFYYFVDWEIFYYKLFHLRFNTSFPALQLYSLTASQLHSSTTSNKQFFNRKRRMYFHCYSPQMVLLVHIGRYCTV